MTQIELLNTIRNEIEAWIKDTDSSQFEKGERFAYNKVLGLLTTVEMSEKRVKFLDTFLDEPKKPDKFPGITRFCDVADNLTRIASGKQPVKGLDLDFQTFAKEMEELWSLPSEETKNDEDNPLRWEYVIARHFAEWGAERRERQMLKESSKKEIEEFMSHCDRAIVDELYRWRFTTVCQEYINQGIFDYGCAKHFAEWGAEQRAIEIFKKQNCHGCGTQRCTGEDEWLEGCREFQKWREEYLKK